MRNRILAIATTCTMCLALVATHRSAQAKVILMTGGEPGEGFAPLRHTAYAYHYSATNPGTTYTMQGVSFAPIFLPFLGSNVTVGTVNTKNAGAYPGGASFLTSAPDDLALQGIGSVLGFGVSHVTPSPMTVTMSGLVPGEKYRLDMFWHYPAATVPATYTVTDANGSIVNSFVGVAAKYYDVQELVTANASGQITVVATNANTDIDTPYLNAFSLTFPEPSSLLAMSVVGLLTTRRRARVGSVVA